MAIPDLIAAQSALKKRAGVNIPGWIPPGAAPAFNQLNVIPGTFAPLADYNLLPEAQRLVLRQELRAAGLLGNAPEIRRPLNALRKAKFLPAPRVKGGNFPRNRRVSK